MGDRLLKWLTSPALTMTDVLIITLFTWLGVFGHVKSNP